MLVNSFVFITAIVRPAYQLGLIRISTVHKLNNLPHDYFIRIIYRDIIVNTTSKWCYGNDKWGMMNRQAGRDYGGSMSEWIWMVVTACVTEV